ncbi:MAG: SpoIIE family protein phosphatase [Clostridia bacterium]|nr:SpoIIE family protein phosphatase [Clostridia bacterium]
MIELFGLIIIYCMVTIAFNTYKQSQNHFYMFLAISFGFIGIPVILHTFTYKGMNVFPGIDANIPTQLYILIRYLTSLAFLTSFYYLKRSLPVKQVVLGFLLLIFLSVFLIFNGMFPDCFIEGQGLTPFKVISEYINIFILIIALGYLYISKNNFHPKVYKYMAYAIFSSIFSSLFFTFYIDVYGFSNILGHIFQVASFYFIYRGIVETSLKTPFDFLYYELKIKNRQLVEYNEKIKAQQKELAQAYRLISEDVNKAREIHSRFLPETLPQIANFNFAYSYKPAQNIGGDFFNIQKIGQQLLIYLVDVSGHGLDGAILNIFIRENINSFLLNSVKREEGISPQKLLTFLYNSYNRESFPNEYFASAFVAVLDLERHMITYSNAGFHISPYLINNSSLERLESSGLPIMNTIKGEKPDYQDHNLQLGDQFTLLLTTDGLVEEMKDDLAYGEERLANILFNNHHLSSQEIVEIIEADFKKFSGQNTAKDDITFLVIKYEPN